MNRFFSILVLLVLMTGTALAETRTLAWDNGESDVFDFLELDSHYINYFKPRSWSKAFPQEVVIFGKRYGDVGNLRATVLILGPQTEKTRQLEASPNSLVIYSTKQFPIADVPEEAGWFTIPLDTIELPDFFTVKLMTYSNEERGLMIGLSPESDRASHSYTYRTRIIDSEAGEPEPDTIPFREDGREWLIRLVVRSTPEMQEAVSADELTGSSFSYFDDGTADGFTTVQTFGPMMHFTNKMSRRIKRVYVYGMVDGDWFNTERTASVYLMDSRFAILNMQRLPYTKFTSEPSWGYVSFDDVKVPKDFYVLVEPHSRPAVELLIGFDSSSENLGSGFGTAGGPRDWAPEIPVETTNWMIRVEYQ